MRRRAGLAREDESYLDRVFKVPMPMDHLGRDDKLAVRYMCLELRKKKVWLIV